MKGLSVQKRKKIRMRRGRKEDWKRGRVLSYHCGGEEWREKCVG
jgi:hypothetical protein